MKVWICRVCGYRHSGSSPPKECPQCSSPGKEFVSGTRKPLRFDGKPFDILIINGSTHASHNTNILVEWAEAILKKEKIRYRRVDLNSVHIDHCWCCYSMKDDACTYPCRNQRDDASPARDAFEERWGAGCLPHKLEQHEREAEGLP